MTKLSVNVNKVATLRNARGGNYPDVGRFALDCERFGAQGITVHPRPDERHIRKEDVYQLKSILNTELNVEGNPTEEFMELVMDVCPAQVTLVPDSPTQLTSNHGWNVRHYLNYLQAIVDELHSKRIRVSIFVDANPEMKKEGYYTDQLNPQYISTLVRSAPLHDVGKINIPDNVLNKPGKLTDEEYEIMKHHTTSGKHIVEIAINEMECGSYLEEARNMTAYHHERWDGKGYPEGLKGEEIPLSARIMAIADVFDALTAPRVYKPGFPLEKSLSIIEDCKGTQFDPKCVDALMDSLPEVKKVLEKYIGIIHEDK